jgi:hypothetical protein
LFFWQKFASCIESFRRFEFIRDKLKIKMESME